MKDINIDFILGAIQTACVAESNSAQECQDMITESYKLLNLNSSASFNEEKEAKQKIHEKLKTALGENVKHEK
jgi:hypothetical protein